jgi:hypothetical protein
MLIDFDYKLILYHIYYAFMPFITQTLTTFDKGTFSKSIVFKVKNTFEPNVLKLVIKTIFINSIYIYIYIFLLINVKILSNFQKEWCTLGRKKICLKNKDCPLSKFECFNMQKYF